MAGDWIKLHRRLLDHPLMMDSWLCHLWIWCLLRANFRPGSFKGCEIGPGQFITGTRSGAECLGVSPSKFWRGLQELSSSNLALINLDVKHSHTVVTVCNWQTYQNGVDETETLMKRKRNADETLMKPIEEGKKGIREERNPLNPPEGEIEIPSVLQSPDFLSVWSEWRTYRKEIKKSLKPSTIKRQLVTLAKWGSAKAIFAISKAIEKGWIGFIEPTEDEMKPAPKPYREATHFEAAHQTQTGMCRFPTCPDCLPKRGKPPDPLMDPVMTSRGNRLQWNPETRENDDDYFR